MHHWEGALGVKHSKKPTHRDEWLSGCVCGRTKTSWPQQTPSGLTHWSKPTTRNLYFLPLPLCVCVWKRKKCPHSCFVSGLSEWVTGLCAVIIYLRGWFACGVVSDGGLWRLHCELSARGGVFQHAVFSSDLELQTLQRAVHSVSLKSHISFPMSQWERAGL